MNQASSLLAFQHAHPPLFPSLLPLRNHRARCLSLIPRAEPEDDNTLSNSQESTVSDPKKPSGSGSGFGTLTESKNKKGKGKEKRTVIRRSPIERPSSLYQSDGAGSASNEERSVNEGAFLLTWLGLGFLILIEGVALAASGFLPEEWDNFFVKYLYPSFTPTVLLFISGTVAYGVLKYLQAPLKLQAMQVVDVYVTCQLRSQKSKRICWWFMVSYQHSNTMLKSCFL